MPHGSPPTGRRTATSPALRRCLVGGAVTAVLALAGCGVHGEATSVGSAARTVGHTAPATRQASAVASVGNGPQVAFGSPYVVDNVAVLISTPTTFTPSGVPATSDGSDIRRAVRCTVSLTNNTTRPLNAHGVEITGLVGGAQVGQVYDRDVQTVTADVPAGGTTSFPVAFNVPTATTRLTVRIAPESMTSNGTVRYTGNV
jgi:hypothetical protein